MSTPVLSFDQVRRTYPGPPSVEALKPCSLDIFSGDLVSVRGPSGSGKSTWLNLAGLLDRPTGGRLALNGLDTADLTEDALTVLRGAWIGFVFQAFHLMPRRMVRENIELPLLYRPMSQPDRRQAVEAIAGRVGLSHRLDAEARHLSGGEMQRVAIARALVGDPVLLLCDEPTGNLDSDNGARVMALLDELNDAGTTIVIITHDPWVADHGRRRLTISDGWVNEDA